MRPSQGARWSALAATIADGTKIASGDRVMIALTDVEVVHAAEAIVEAVYARGAHPQVQLVDERFDEIALQAASEEGLAITPELEAMGLEWADIYVAIRGLRPPRPFAAPASRLALQRAAKGRISAMRWNNTRWCIVRVPTPAWAEWLDQPLDELLSQFFAASVRDWRADRERWEQMAASLEGAKHVEITGDRTDLSFSIEGRSWIVFAGERNLPDGELATAPHLDSVHGTIHFPGPIVFAGEYIEGLELRWDRGRLVGLTADVGEAVACSLIETDDGASAVGEFGIGVNEAISQMTGDLFFDEKILGTVHIALGRAYTDCGGTNQSALHWDLVKDLRPSVHRPGGTLLIDNALVIDNGDLRLAYGAGG